MWALARSGAIAHRWSLAGTAAVIALAAALLATSGTLLESGVRLPQSPDAVQGGLTAVASSFIGTAMIVVVLVVASTTRLAMRPRQRDLAVFRALRATRKQVRQMVSIEVLLVSAVAAPLGSLPGLWLTSRLTPLLTDAGLVSPGFDPVLSPLPALGAVMLVAPIAVLAARLATAPSSCPPRPPSRRP